MEIAPAVKAKEAERKNIDRAIWAMAEIGISMRGQKPKLITQEPVSRADHVIWMGFGVDSDACPAHSILIKDWELDDPAGQSIESVRLIRDEIGRQVSALLEEPAKT